MNGTPNGPSHKRWRRPRRRRAYVLALVEGEQNGTELRNDTAEELGNENDSKADNLA
jgi:hypothetical protein